MMSRGGLRVRVLCGMGGCGKTSIAVEVAARAEALRIEAWWASAAQRDRFTAGMLAVARRLGIEERELRGGDTADLTWRQLNTRPEPWLLVIDNADDLDVLSVGLARLEDGTGWVRPVRSGHGLVLVTTRDGRPGAWGPWCQLHKVGVLGIEDAVRVLADHAGAAATAASPREARDLAGRLGGLPLALRLAGSYLAEAAGAPAAFARPGAIRSYAGYLAALGQGQLDRVFPAPEDRELSRVAARELIGRTWELSLDLLSRRGMPDARVLLRLLAALADAPIPYELLLDSGTLAASPLLEGTTGPRIWQLLQALAGFGLIDLDAPGPLEEVSGGVQVLRLHPLVRDASRHPADADGDDDQAAFLGLAAALAAHAASLKQTGLPEDPQKWPVWQSLTPHAFYLLDSSAADKRFPAQTRKDAAYAAYLAARYRAEHGSYAEAEDRFRLIMEIQAEVLGAEHPSTLATRYEIARTMAERGDNAGAEAEFRAVLDARTRVLGAEHPSTLATRHEIALIMGNCGDHVGAEAEFRAILDVETRILGAEHHEVLIIRCAAAFEMGAYGDHVGAEAEFRAVLDVETRVLGAEHPSTLTTRNEIAWTMAERGDNAGAEAEFRAVLDARTRVLGAEHPSTLTTRNEIARIMAERGDNAGAEAEFRAVLDARTRVLGAEHPSTLATERALKALTANHGKP